MEKEGSSSMGLDCQPILRLLEGGISSQGSLHIVSRSFSRAAEKGYPWRNGGAHAAEHRKEKPQRYTLV